MERDFTKEPLVMSKSEPFYKPLAILISFIQQGLFLSPTCSVSYRENDFIMNFEKIDQNFIQCFDRNSDEKMNVLYTDTNKKIQLKFRKILNEVRHLADMSFSITQNNETNQLEVKHANQIINKVLFYEESWNNIIPKMIDLMSFNIPLIQLELKINEFYKIKKYSHLINNNYPINKELIDKFIKISNKLETLPLNRIKFGPFNISYHNKTYDIYFGGVKLVHEFDLNKFKYLNHPALNFIVNLMEDTGLFINFNSTINKSLIKMV